MFSKILNQLHKNKEFTHMPFLVDEHTMFFCIGDKAYCGDNHKDWKICCINNGDFFRINTKLPKGTVECSPTAFVKNGKHYLYFLASIPEDTRYRMYGCVGPSWTSLSSAIASNRITYHGFINPQLQTRTIFHKNYDISIIIENMITNSVKTLVAKNQFINKVSYLSEDHSKIILSLRKTELQINSRDYTDIQTITKPNHELYKCSIYQNICMYGKKLEKMDEREIVTITDITYKKDKLSNWDIIEI
jgi:hypothetical protein